MDELLDECDGLPLLTVEPGELVIRQGDPPGALWVLVGGGVTIERDGVSFARIDTPGAVLGEMSVVLGGPATASARTTERCTFRRGTTGWPSSRPTLEPRLPSLAPWPAGSTA